MKFLRGKEIRKKVSNKLRNQAKILFNNNTSGIAIGNKFGTRFSFLAPLFSLMFLAFWAVYAIPGTINTTKDPNGPSEDINNITPP